MRTADFFLAFEEKFQVDRNIPGCFKPGRCGEQLQIELSLVIGRTARIKTAINNLRAERRVVPHRDGIHWLHIVVPIDHDPTARLLGRPVSIMGPYYGMPPVGFLDPG